MVEKASADVCSQAKALDAPIKLIVSQLTHVLI